MSRDAATHRWLLAAVLAGALAGLGGCASQIGGAGASASGQAASSSEADIQRRARLRLELAVTYLESGNLPVAMEEANQALATDPGYADAYHVRGLVYMAQQDLAHAETDLKRAQGMKPNDPDIQQNLGWLLCQRGQYAQANALFERALATPGYLQRSRTFLSQGMCHQRAGQLAEAEQAVLHAYEIDAGNPLVGYHLASIIFARGDAQRARFYVRRINNSEAANAESLWLGVKIERALKDLVAMRQLGDQLQRRFPQSRQTLALERGAFNE